jgi:hypothetical protein
MSSGFFIPDLNARFSTMVEKRFDVLIKKRVLQGIEVLQLRNWLGNFQSDEARYLAAQLLDSLVYRSDKMLESSSNHVLQMMLPNVLSHAGEYKASDLHTFLERIVKGDTSLGIRFVVVDGTFTREPGKSGSTVLRTFGRATGVPDSLFMRPENLSGLGRDVRALVFLDDCLGTGTQFVKYSKHYKLKNQCAMRKLIYVPYVAHEDGIRALHNNFPELIVRPAETLGANSDFFAADPQNPSIWARDKKNSVADVKAFYKRILKDRGVNPNESEFCLNLSLAFSMSAPNNTLKIFHTTEGQWSRLVIR